MIYQMTDQGLIFLQPISKEQTPNIIRELIRSDTTGISKKLDWYRDIKPYGDEVKVMYIWQCPKHHITIPQKIINEIVLGEKVNLVRALIHSLTKEGIDPVYTKSVFQGLNDKALTRIWNCALYESYYDKLAVLMPLKSLPLSIGIKSKDKWDKQEWKKIVEQRMRDNI